MAQLIKLRDYISRYETNPLHYPTQFIRLKQENWKKLLQTWEFENEEERAYMSSVAEEDEKRQGVFRRFNPFQKRKEKEQALLFYKRNTPASKKQLKQYFLNQLFPFQLKWATSTLTQISYTERNHYYDSRLKYLLQHFPDIYLVMYEPIFSIKKAPVDLEIMMISPVEIEIISFLDTEANASILVQDERTWTIESKDRKERILSPVIALKRTEHIIQSVLQSYDLTYPIKKTVLSADAYFLPLAEPYNVSLIGLPEYQNWYDTKRSLSGSLKAAQLKVMEVLLEHSLSTSVRRPEWERDQENDEASFIIGE